MDIRDQSSEGSAPPYCRASGNRTGPPTSPSSPSRIELEERISEAGVPLSWQRLALVASDHVVGVTTPTYDAVRGIYRLKAFIENEKQRAADCAAGLPAPSILGVDRQPDGSEVIVTGSASDRPAFRFDL
ncbi:hypothetical protein E1286_17010 [Nonomuraea terrae]|uniref:Uncharacterized protein n=1 Tax=Nonomuraea terrae TaxID=2530383 RepID=A0A4V2YLV8_9ACTN|nr:hypothetical protein [Nonomuraea terrae]TDD47627.1 hypothetical protein E1286_17010 [Nonomuraea terrae]